MSDQSERGRHAGAESGPEGYLYQGTPTPVIVTGGGTSPYGEADLEMVTIGYGDSTETPPALFDVLEPRPGAQVWLQSRSRGIGFIDEVLINEAPQSFKHPLKLTFKAGEDIVFTIEEEPGAETYQLLITAASPGATFTTTETSDGVAWVKASVEPSQQITQVLCGGDTEPVQVKSLFTVNLNFILL